MTENLCVAREDAERESLLMKKRKKLAAVGACLLSFDKPEFCLLKLANKQK